MTKQVEPILYINASDYVTNQIATNIGFNIRIDNVKHIGKDLHFTLKAIIPHVIKLGNGHKYDGVLEVKDIDIIIMTEHKNGYSVKREANLDYIDEKLRIAIRQFKERSHVTAVIFDGEKQLD